MKDVCMRIAGSFAAVFAVACQSEKPEPEFSLARMVEMREPFVCPDVSSRTVKAPKSLAGKRVVIREGERPEVSWNKQPQLGDRSRDGWSVWSPWKYRWGLESALILDFSSGDDVKETHRMNDGQDWTRSMTYGRKDGGRKGVVFEYIPTAAMIPGPPGYFGTEWSLYFTAPDRGYAVRENFHEWAGERVRGYCFMVEDSPRKLQ
ncbi:hypothetical protein [Akkermansia glycaniphila]|nr:hypothetical protein [Akkermansia glycaniphila]